MIKIISQSTSEREKETKELFNKIKPLLDEGYSYMTACIEIGKVPKNSANGHYSNGWFKDLKEYGNNHGYKYMKYKGKRGYEKSKR